MFCAAACLTSCPSQRHEQRKNEKKKEERKKKKEERKKKKEKEKKKTWPTRSYGALCAGHDFCDGYQGALQQMANR